MSEPEANMDYALVERVAEAICSADRLIRMQRGGYLPTWQELLAQGWEAGKRRAEEYRTIARAAVVAAEPAIRPHIEMSRDASFRVD